MINNGFTNIHYIVDKAGVNALSYDVTFIKPENIGNIIFTNSNDGIVKKFIHLIYLNFLIILQHMIYYQRKGMYYLIKCL